LLGARIAMMPTPWSNAMYSKILKRVTALVAAVLVLGNPQPARADHPLFDIAVIVAGAATVVGTAIIVAGVTIAVAIVVTDDDCECGETRTEGDGEGEEGEGEGDGTSSGGGEQSSERTMRPPALVFQSPGASVSGSALRPASATFDDASTHPAVTSFIDRSGALRVARSGNGAAGIAEYHFDGDIRRAPQGLHKFTHDETLRFDVLVDTRTIQDARACTALTLKNMRLATEDIPQTDGSVKLTIDVIQNGVTTNTRELLVRKGQVPQRPAWATGPGWVFAKDRIDLTSAVLAVPCTPDPNGMPTPLRIAVKTQFIGARD
jgi:hypothetical protein